LVAWYPSLYAPRTGGVHDSHHRTAGIAGRARRRGGRVALGCRPRATARKNAAHRRAPERRRGRSGLSGLGRGGPAGACASGRGQAGWIIGRNVRIDTRWAGGKPDDVRRYAAELVALAPDVILAHGTSTVRPLLQATRTVPIVFPIAADPVGAGFVDSLARPG